MRPVWDQQSHFAGCAGSGGGIEKIVRLRLTAKSCGVQNLFGRLCGYVGPVLRGANWNWLEDQGA